MTLDRLRRIVGLRLRTLRHGSAVDRELDEELRYHLDRQIEENIASGMSESSARTAALRAMGGVQQRKEECQDQRGLSVVDALVLDLRHALRVLKRSPMFTTVAVLSLAFGVGAFLAIFQLVDAIRFRLLPVPNAHELVELRVAGGRGGWGVSETANSEITYPLWEGIRLHQTALSEIFAWGRVNLGVGEGANVQVVRGLWVSGDFFKTLRVQPVRGRLLSAEHDRRGCAAGALVISHTFWLRHFGGDEGVVGAPITILRQRFEVAGVVAPEFTGLEVGRSFDVALPVCAAALWGNSIDRRDLWWLTVMGRLSPSFTLAQATDQVRGLSPALFESTVPTGYSAASLDTYRGFRLTAIEAGRGVSRLRTVYATPLWLLLGTTGLILLLTTGNLATLMLARANARRREFSVLVALGAARRRLISQIVAEAVVIAAAGVCLAVPVALGASRTLIALISTDMDPLHVALDLDWRVVGFAAAVALLTSLVFGLAPALQSSKLDPAAALQAGGRSQTTDRRRATFQRSLVIGQLAVCFVLVVSALLFVRSFQKLATTEVGFNANNLKVVSFGDPYISRLPHHQRLAFQRELIETLGSIPGVESAAAASQTPLSGASWTQAFTIPRLSGTDRLGAKFTYVSPGYFQTLQVPILSGRDIGPLDAAASKPIALVNETFVRKFLGGSPPVAVTFRTVGEAGYPPTEYEVVGMVGDTKYGDVREEPTPIVFVPLAQVPTLSSWKNVLLRTAAGQGAITHEVKRRVARLDPEIVVFVGDLPQQLRNRLTRERVLAWLAAVFGVLAISLAAIGLYGLIAYLSHSRRNEIGVRLALGARRSEVVLMMLKEMAWLLIAGVGAGVIVSLGLARAIGTLVFGLSSNDITTFAVSGLTLAAAAGIAALVPAWRASRVDPIATLRAETS